MVCIVAKLAVNFQLMVFEVPLSGHWMHTILLCAYLAWGGWERRESFTVVFNHYNRELAQNKIWEGVKNCLSSCSHNGEDAGSWVLMFFVFTNKV